MTTPNSGVLTGQVFVHGVLEAEFSRRKAPRQVNPFDIRIHAHLDENGAKKRARGFCRDGYSGVFRASIFDGKRWRKFMLANQVESDLRQFAQYSERYARGSRLIARLASFKGRSVVYRDGAFALLPESAVSSPRAVPSSNDAVVAFVAATAPVVRVAETVIPLPKLAVSMKRRRRKPDNDSAQLKLF